MKKKNAESKKTPTLDKLIVKVLHVDALESVVGGYAPPVDKTSTCTGTSVCQPCNC